MNRKMYCNIIIAYRMSFSDISFYFDGVHNLDLACECDTCSFYGHHFVVIVVHLWLKSHLFILRSLLWRRCGNYGTYLLCASDYPLLTYDILKSAYPYLKLFLRYGAFETRIVSIALNWRFWRRCGNYSVWLSSASECLLVKSSYLEISLSLS